MRRDAARLLADQTVGEALAAVRAAPPEGRIIYFYVVDDAGRLEGVVPTRRLLLAAEATPLRSIMITKAIAIPATATVLAADQVGVLGTSRGPVLLTKAADAPAACRQLRGLSGTTHLLHNGLVVARGDRTVTGLDTQAVTFRELADDEIHDYVERFRPFDTAGSYRLEDDRVRGGRPFVVGVEGEDPSGVLGLPLPLLRRMLTTLDGGAPTTP